ncbi:hypothetical protein Moror_4228 [Moniliophthora roreri MCA 2997]|uniref:Uncharacterized protein n=2 Tax=Moniliophthora roreri TaxID=221103 RepID=V2XA18_MONRO|nr:hypothetical protein Moror_4228 [Moniliophthora roreri MCA 2997]KAI3602794.1 hypothetical protein WG66_008095 [Moniliophthora roreri]
MSSGTSSGIQALLDPPVELCNRCHHSYPSDFIPSIPVIGQYLAEYPGNHVALDNEIPLLGEALREALVELDGYDLELERMEDAVRKMRERRECLWDMTTRLSGMIKSSIRRLPPEILARVFFMAWDTRTLPWTESSCKVPLVLGQVCSQWRTIVHSCPQLWSNIIVNFHVDDDEASARRILKWTKYCLEKSRPKPLRINFTLPESVYFDENDEEHYYHYGLHRSTLDELLKHCARWAVANVELKEEDHIILPESLPMLEELSIERERPEFFEEENIPFVAFPHSSVVRSAPRLSNLHISGLEVQVLEQIDLTSLTRLTHDICYLGTLLYLLRHSPNLSEVQLMDYRNDVDPFAHGVTSSSLRTLRAEWISPLSDLFQYLTLPCITSLYIKERYRSDAGETFDPNFPEFRQFIERSRPPLTHLYLSSPTLLHEELVRVLAMLPSISHLELDSSFNDVHLVTDDLLRYLTVTSTSSPDDVLLPNLIDLRLSFKTKPTGEYVLEMVQSRVYVKVHGKTKGLVFLSLDFWYGTLPVPSVRERIEELRKEGLKLDTIYHMFPEIDTDADE